MIITTRQATSETETPTWTEFDGDRLRSPRFVAVDASRVVGWAALSAASVRDCYSGVVEHSIFVSAGVRGKGVGRTLMDTLIRSADEGGIWTIQTNIFPENEASLALHERVGFRVVGRRERIAQLDGAWRDTILLERRV